MRERTAKREKQNEYLRPNYHREKINDAIHVQSQVMQNLQKVFKIRRR